MIELYSGARNAFGAAWHRASFDECFGLVKERWEDDAEAGHYFDYLYEVTQRRNNLMLHPSPTAFRQTNVTWPDGSYQLNRIGPDGYWKQALNDGCGGFYLCMKVLAEEFGFDRDPIAAIFNRATTLLRRLEEESAFADP